MIFDFIIVWVADLKTRIMRWLEKWPVCYTQHRAHFWICRLTKQDGEMELEKYIFFHYMQGQVGKNTIYTAMVTYWHFGHL